MLLRTTLFAIASLTFSVVATSAAPTSATNSLLAMRADEKLALAVLRNAPSFADVRLSPDARKFIYAPSWGLNAAYTADGEPMYVQYELPLPPGATAGREPLGLGVLNSGKITAIAPPTSQGYSIEGRRGDSWVVVGPNGHFVLRGMTLQKVSDTIHFDDLSHSNGCGTLSDGSRCIPATGAGDVIAYAESPQGVRRTLLTKSEVAEALHGTPHEQQVWCFHFAGRDFYDFKGIIFRIDGASLKLVGPGTPKASSRGHILLVDTRNPEAGQLNEELFP